MLATLHDPAYRAANAGALRMEWPRIPLPGWPDGAAEALAASAARGRALAQLLDSDTPVPGITTGALRPEVAVIAVPTTTDERNMTGEGIVQCGRNWQSRRMTSPSPSYRRISVSTRDHQPRCLALPPILSEFPRCGRSARPARHHSFVRNHPPLVADVRSRLRTKVAAPPSPPGRHLVSG